MLTIYDEPEAPNEGLCMVNRAAVSGIRGRLQQLVKHASDGKPLKSSRAERRKRAREKKRQPATAAAIGTGKGRGQGSHAWQVDRSLVTISAGEAKRRLEEQQPLNAEAIVVKNGSQAESLVNLAQVSAYKGQVAVISQDDLGEKAKKLDVPCIKGDRRSVKQWSSVALTADGCPAQTVLRKTSTFKPPVREVKTLRILGVRE